MFLTLPPSLVGHLGTLVTSLLNPSKPLACKTSFKNMSWVALGTNLVIVAASAVISHVVIKGLNRFSRSTLLDGEAPSERSIRARLQKILKKRFKYIPSLNHYERIVADSVIDPDDIEVSFADIGGLDDTKQEIFELAVLPLLRPDLFSGKKIATRGILLYGQPGTGKTMLAKVIAKEANSTFIPIKLSTILSKWAGESNKLVAATFSLARKLQPTILFIDEIDTFFDRSGGCGSALSGLKSEFLTLWDGIGTSSKDQILVLGATNYPQSIDTAILRRLPRTFEVPLPDVNGRQSILSMLLREESLSIPAKDYISSLAKDTEGYSGSDLKELCQAAGMVRVRELLASMSRQRMIEGTTKTKSAAACSAGFKLRAISLEDLKIALQKVQRTGEAAKEYGRERQLDFRRAQ